VRHGAPADKPAWTRYFSVDYGYHTIMSAHGIIMIASILLGIS
jgi:hypothetical protein